MKQLTLKQAQAGEHNLSVIYEFVCGNPKNCYECDPGEECWDYLSRGIVTVNADDSFKDISGGGEKGGGGRGDDARY